MPQLVADDHEASSVNMTVNAANDMRYDSYHSKKVFQKTALFFLYFVLVIIFVKDKCCNVRQHAQRTLNATVACKIVETFSPKTYSCIVNIASSHRKAANSLKYPLPVSMLSDNALNVVPLAN